MHLTQPFLQLPVRFCADRLAAEVAALPASAWVPHPQGFPGNEAVRLITAGGEENDQLHGPMAPTEHLARCPYILDAMAELGAVWGRSRLMGLGPGAQVPSHVDIHYYWRTHIRIHIPVITNPGVRFTCDGESMHIPAGECWVLDTFRRHGVENKGTEQRVHLVLDTVGGERLWELIEAAQSRAAANPEPRLVMPGTVRREALAFEQLNTPLVMSPWEVRCHLAFLAEQAVPHPRLDAAMARLDKFATAWAALWAQFGTDAAGLPSYQRLIDSSRAEFQASGAERVLLRNGRALSFVVDALLFANAVAASQTQDQIATAAEIGTQSLAS